MKGTRRLRMTCTGERVTNSKVLPHEFEFRWADSRKYADHKLTRIIIQSSAPISGYEVGKTYLFDFKEEEK